jgi:hypothetical protein
MIYLSLLLLMEKLKYIHTYPPIGQIAESERGNKG